MRKTKRKDQTVINLEAGGSIAMGLEDVDGNIVVRLVAVIMEQPHVMMWLDAEAMEDALTAMGEIHKQWRRAPLWRRLLGLRQKRRAISVDLLYGATLVLSLVKDESELVLAVNAMDAERGNTELLLSADEAHDLYEDMDVLYEAMPG